MAVYLIRAGAHGPVKIGFAEDIDQRLVKMQCDNHERLTVMRRFAGGKVVEAALHDRFSTNHLHGEWFSFSKEMLGDLGLTEIIEEEPEPAPAEAPPALISGDIPDLRYALRLARINRGLTQQGLADKLGIKRSSLASIETGHDLPGRDLLIRMSRVLGVSVIDGGAA